MIIQRQNYRPNQPPHFAKCGGNLALKSELYDQCQKIKLPLVFLHFSRLGDSPPSYSDFPFGDFLMIFVHFGRAEKLALRTVKFFAQVLTVHSIPYGESASTRRPGA